MKFGEFVLALSADQYIAWVDHTLPDKKIVWREGKRIEKHLDPFTKPMKVGNITLDRIGSRTNLYEKDIYGIKSCRSWKGKEYPDGVIFFHVTDRQETRMHLAMHHVMKICKDHGYFG